MANTAKLGFIWKALGWGDGEPVPRVTLPDGTKAEGMAALTYGYDGSIFQKLLVDGSGNLKVVSAGGGSAVSIADAADTVEGALADAAIITDTTGTVNGKLRGLVKWAFERMPASLGQKTMAASLPIVVASDQTAFPVTANAGTNLNTSALALDAHLTDGTQKAITRGGAKGATTAADLTGTAEGADHQALDVQVYHGGAAKDPTAIRALTTADAVNVGQWIGSAAPTVGSKTGANSVPVVIASDQAALAAPTLTKGTQGATGYSVQELKDAGRVNIMWTAEFAATAVTEALLTVTESRDGAATSTFTTKVVTSAKRLRITSVQMTVESGGSTGTAIQRAILRMRFNTAGAVVVGSPLQAVWQVGTSAATLKNSQAFAADFPDGIEFLGDGTKQIGFTLTNPDWVVTTSIPTTRITITAFEY